MFNYLILDDKLSGVKIQIQVNAVTITVGRIALGFQPSIHKKPENSSDEGHHDVCHDPDKR